MKRFWRWFFYLIALWIVFGIGYRGLGGFANLRIVEKEVGPYVIVYIPFTGDLMNVHDTMDIVKQALSQKQIVPLGAASIFDYEYSWRKADRVREYGGMRIASQDASKLDKHSDIYRIRIVPVETAPTIIFPYKASFSCILWHLRSTGKLNEYLQSQNRSGATIIEIFDKAKTTISYIAE